MSKCLIGNLFGIGTGILSSMALSLHLLISCSNEEKNGIKLADFIREPINTIISKKPVKSRIIEDFERIKNVP